MFLRIISITLLLIMAAWPAAAQTDLVTISAQVSPAQISPGQKAVLVVKVTVADGFHINSNAPKQEDFIPTVLEVSGADGFKLHEAVFPKPHAKKVSFSPEPVELFDGVIEIKQEMTAKPDAAAGKRQLKILLNYQACDDQMCMMPGAVEANAQVVVK